MRTFSARPRDITRSWYVLDATELPLGRLATKVAALLSGKTKPSFTPHIDGGDYVVVINAANLVVTGKKPQQKQYYRHSQYPGGLKQANLSQQLEKDPTRIIIKAVRGMLPANKLRDARLARLKVYTNAAHPHDPQKPIKVSLKS